MAKIHTLKISNYRGIKQFNQVFGITDFVCIIGRGDSGKTSILEAIAAVLSPNWNLSFYDTDFYDANIENAIEIEVSLYDIPVKLLQESKFGLYVRGLNTLTNTIDDNINDSDEIILTIIMQDIIGEKSLFENINFVELAQLSEAEDNELIYLYDLQFYLDQINLENNNTENRNE